MTFPRDPRYLALALTVACSPAQPTSPPNNASTPAPARIPADLGSLVLVTAPVRTDAMPMFTPINVRIPLVDPTRRMPPNTPMHVVDARGASGTFTSGEPTQITYGCDGNQLDVTPLAGTTQLAPGVAWAIHAPEVRPTARPPVVSASEARATYDFGELTIIIERDAQKKDRGFVRFVVGGAEAARSGFARTLMDGADPALATIDLREGGPSVPVPIAAWSIDGSGRAPFMVALEHPGWEGTTIEAWLVEARSVRQIEAMTAYLYQCAF